MFACEQCSFGAETKVALKYHGKSIHNLEKMKCDQCDYECEYKTGCTARMKKHKSSMHGEKVYKCDKCDYQSDGWSNGLDKHKKFVHNKGNYIACNQCDFNAVYPSLVDIHKKGVHEGVRWSCSVCEKQFKSPMLLKAHTNKKHDKILHKEKGFYLQSRQILGRK